MLERLAARLTVNMAVIALLVIFAAIQTVRIEGFKVWPISVKGYKAEAVELRAELRRISTAKNEQGKITTRTIERVRVVEKDADKQAKRVETAPVSGQCRTPEAVLQADL